MSTHEKTLSVLLCLVTLLFASACGKSTDTPVITTDTAAPTPVNAVDVDLTKLSSTKVYSEVYTMMTEPENYIGNLTRENEGGQMYLFGDEDNGRRERDVRLDKAVDALRSKLGADIIQRGTVMKNGLQVARKFKASRRRSRKNEF